MWLPGFPRDFPRVLMESRTSELKICNLIYVKTAVSFEIFCYSPVAHAFEIYRVFDGCVVAWEIHKGAIALFDGNVWLFVTAQVGWLAFDQSRGRYLNLDGGGWVELPQQTE